LDWEEFKFPLRPLVNENKYPILSLSSLTTEDSSEVAF